MSLIVLPAVRPPSIADADNGHISADELVNIGGATVRMLALEAATAYVQLRDACLTATGVFFAVMGGGAYRSYNDQVSLFNQRYQFPPMPGRPTKTWQGRTYSLRPDMATAAVPGTSNHGLGAAVDIAIPVVDDNAGHIITYTGITSSAAWPWLLAHAVAAGWSWELQSEPWHLHLCALPVRPPVVPAPITHLEAGMLHVVDGTTGEFWRIYADATGALVATPLRETPRGGDWDRFGKISDKVIGPLVTVPHDWLQAMYDVQGRPTPPVGTPGPPGAVSTVPGPPGPPGAGARPHHHDVPGGETGDAS